MSLRRPRHLRITLLPLVLTAVFASMGAQHRTPNFVVQAPTQAIAERAGQWAEYYRKQKALEWLGHEMPNWTRPCPLVINVTMGDPSGATTFTFGQRGEGVTSQHMQIQGPLDRLIYSVLPHEVTHTVFAYYFRCPVPRWADEGGAVLSEDDLELEKHNKIVRTILNRGQQFPLRRLLSLKDYPGDHSKVVCLYAQGFSLAHYLVYVSNKQNYLKFVAHGMRGGWDSAAHTFFGYRSVEEMEQAWLKHLRETKGMTIMQLAQLKSRPQPVQGEMTGRTVTRLTLPPTDPLQQSEPVFRGAAPTQEDQGQHFGDKGQRPGYLPNYQGAPAQGWQPAPVRLRAPEAAPAPVTIGQPMNRPPGSPGQ